MIKILKASVYNRMLLACFLIIMLCNLFSLLSLYDWVSTTTNSLITFLSLPVAIIIAVYPKLRKNNENTYVNYNTKHNKEEDVFAGLINYREINENKSRLLKRDHHKKSIIKKIEEIFALDYNAKGLVLTGESGAGKSILVRFVEKDLLDMGYNVKILDKYNIESEFPEIIEGTKNVFIFDQFERSLDFNTIDNWIEKNSNKFKDCVFLFSFPQKFLTGIYNKIHGKNSDFYLQSYILYLDDEDEIGYLEKIAKITDTQDTTVFEVWKEINSKKGNAPSCDKATNLVYLLERELYKVKKGISPLIEMEFLGEMIEKPYGNRAPITDDNFIACYFDDWVNKFDRKETAYAILTLFTQFKSYSLEDIELITFEDTGSLVTPINGSIFDLMSNNTFLNGKIGGRGLDTKSGDCTFSPKHEYVSRAIQNYLASKDVPGGVKCYTEHYRVNHLNSNYKDRVKKHYNNYIKNHVSLNISLVLMLSALIVINFVGIFSETKSVDLVLHKLAITAVSFPSIFYIYNYCDKIMYAKGRIGAFITGLVGCSTIVASYIFPGWWGIFLGIEIIVFSFFVFISLAFRTVKEARANLIKDSIIFVFIGITISALGVVFLLFFSPLEEMSWRYNLLKYSYYVLFVIYCVMSDYNHIRYYYICSKIGYLNMFDV